MKPITLPGNLDSLSTIREYVSSAAKTAGLEKNSSYKLMLAVDELATNSIKHGYEENGLQGDLVISAEITGSELIVTVEDSAPAYDPRTHKLSECNEPCKSLDEREIGGLGIYLALQDVDRFNYQRINGKNHNIFAMTIRKEKPAS